MDRSDDVFTRRPPNAGMQQQQFFDNSYQQQQQQTQGNWSNRDDHGEINRPRQQRMNDNRAFHQGGLGRDGVRNFEPQNEARNSRLDLHDSGVKNPIFDLRDSVFALGNSGHGSGNPVFASSDRGDNRRQDYSRDLNARVDRNLQMEEYQSRSPPINRNPWVESRQEKSRAEQGKINVWEEPPQGLRQDRDLRLQLTNRPHFSTADPRDEPLSWPQQIRDVRSMAPQVEDRRSSGDHRRGAPEAPGVAKEVVNSYCRLVYYDEEAEIGIVSFSHRRDRAYAFFQQSVFVSDSIDLKSKQLTEDSKFKFHGFHLNPGHEIPFLVSVLWPVSANLQIGYMRPAEDDEELYHKHVDRCKVYVRDRLNSENKIPLEKRRSRSRSKGRRRTRSRSKDRRRRPSRSRSRGRKRSGSLSRGGSSRRQRSPSGGQKRSASPEIICLEPKTRRIEKSCNAAKDKEGLPEDNRKKDKDGRIRKRSESRERKIRNRALPEIEIGEISKRNKQNSDLLEIPSGERSEWYRQNRDLPEIKPGGRSGSIERKQRNRDLPEITLGSRSERNRQNSNSQEIPSGERSEWYRRNRDLPEIKPGGRSGSIEWQQQNRDLPEIKSGERSGSVRQGQNRELPEIQLNELHNETYQRVGFHDHQPNANGSQFQSGDAGRHESASSRRDSQPEIISIPDSPEPASSDARQETEMEQQIREAEQKLQQKMAQLQALKARRAAQSLDKSNPTEAAHGSQPRASENQMQGPQMPGNTERADDFGSREYGGHSQLQQEGHLSDSVGHYRVSQSQEPQLSHDSSRMKTRGYERELGKKDHGGSINITATYARDQKEYWSGSQIEYSGGGARHDDYYDPREALDDDADDEDEPVFGKRLTENRNHSQPPDFREGTASPILKLLPPEEPEEQVMFGRHLSSDVPEKVAAPLSQPSNETIAASEKKKEERKQKIFSKLHTRKKEKAASYRRPSGGAGDDEDDDVVPLLPAAQVSGDDDGTNANQWKPKVHKIVLKNAAPVQPDIDSLPLAAKQLPEHDTVDRSKKIPRHPPKPVAAEAQLPLPPPISSALVLPNAPAPPIISKAVIQKKKLVAEAKKLVQKKVEADKIKEWEKELEERIKGKLNKSREAKSGGQDKGHSTLDFMATNYGGEDPANREFDRQKHFGEPATAAAPASQDLGRSDGAQSGAPGAPLIQGYNKTLTGVNETMSKDIMNDTSDAFSMVAPIHQRELQLGNRKITECGDFIPGTRQQVEFAIIGEYNILWMSGMCPATEKDLNIWRNVPLLTISSQASMKENRGVMLQTLERLAKEYKSESTHVLIFTGFSDAPYIRAEDIFDSFLAIVEDAIRFNLEYNTNFSVSFGEILFPAFERRYDRIILLINEVARIINHYFLQSESIKQWQLGVEEAKSDSSNQVGVMGMNVRVRTDKYNDQDPTILNDSSLFKLNKYIRLAMSNRYDTMDRIMNRQVPPPTGVNKLGLQFRLPEPKVPAGCQMGLCDVLVNRMRTVIASGPDIMGAGLAMMPRPTLDIAAMEITEKGPTVLKEGFSVEGRKEQGLPPPGIAIPTTLGEQPKNISAGGHKRSRWENLSSTSALADKSFNVVQPVHGKGFHTPGGHSYMEFGNQDPSWPDVRVSAMVIGDCNVHRLASVLPSNQVSAGQWKREQLFWISSTGSIAAVRECIEYSLERITYKYTTNDTKFLLYFGCESMSDIHPSAIYPSLMAIIEDVMIFNLRHQTRFTVAFAESIYPARNRNHDAIVHTANLIIRIINYYVLNAHNIQMWRDISKANHMTAAVMVNKLNVKGSRLTILANCFDASRSEFLNYDVVFKLATLLRIQVSGDGLIDPEGITSGRLQPPAEVIGAKLWPLPAPLKPPEKLHWGYLQLLKAKCFARLNYENNPVVHAAPNASGDSWLNLDPLRPQPDRNCIGPVAAAAMHAEAAAMSKKVDYIAVLNKSATTVTTRMPPFVPQAAVDEGTEFMETLVASKYVAAPAHSRQYHQNLESKDPLFYTESCNTTDLQGKVDAVVLGDRLVHQMGTINNTASANQAVTEMWNRRRFLWVSAQTDKCHSLEAMKDILEASLARVASVYQSRFSMFIMCLSPYALSWGCRLRPPAAIITAFFRQLLAIVQTVVQFNQDHATSFTIAFTEVYYPGDVRHLDANVYNVNNLIRSINHFVLQAVSVSFSSIFSSAPAAADNTTNSNDDQDFVHYNIGFSRPPQPPLGLHRRRFHADNPRLPDHETAFLMVSHLRAKFEEVIIRPEAALNRTVVAPSSLTEDCEKYALKGPLKTHSVANLTCMQIIEKNTREKRQGSAGIQNFLSCPAIHILGPTSSIRKTWKLPTAVPASDSPATTTAKTSKEDKASGSQASLPNPAAEAVLVREEVEEEKEEAEEEREEAEEKKEEVEDQTEVLVGDEQDFRTVIATDEFTSAFTRDNWFQPSDKKPPNFAVITEDLCNLNRKFPVDEELQALWEHAPCLWITKKKKDTHRGSLKAALRRLKNLNTSDNFPIFIHYVPFNFRLHSQPLCDRDLIFAFDNLLSLVECAMEFNAREGTNFEITFVEITFPHERSLDNIVFMFNEIVSIVNYHFNESFSPKLWRFMTTYDNVRPNVNVKNVNLRIDKTKINDFEIWSGFLRFIRDRIDSGSPLEREEQPPLGIDVSGRIFELPLPIKSVSGSFRSVLQERANSLINGNNQEIDRPTLDIATMKMFPRHTLKENKDNSSSSSNEQTSRPSIISGQPIKAGEFVDISKRSKNIWKKLRQIETLEAKIKAGELTPTKNHLGKIARKAKLEREIKRLDETNVPQAAATTEEGNGKQEDDDDEEMLEDPSDCLLPPSLDADEDGGICEN